VGEVTHDLKLEFLPAEHRLFDQHLVNGRKIKPAGKDVQQIFAIVSESSAGAAQGERWTDDDRKTDLPAEFETVFEIVHQRRLRDVEADLLHRVFEEQAVLGHLDRAELGSDKLHVVLLENLA